MINLLFLCTGNSCRSQMAEAFARARADKDVAVYSAGTAPMETVHPLAVRVMAEGGVDISAQKPKAIEALSGIDVDVVITVCDRAAQACPTMAGNPARCHWNLPDPAEATGTEDELLAAFRKARDDIRRRVDDLFAFGYLQALAQAKCKADIIMDSISEGIIAHDNDRKIFYFNRAAEQITGYRRDEVLNRDCVEVFSGGLCGGRCSFVKGEPPSYETKEEAMDITTKGGEVRHVAMLARAMTNGDGAKIGVLVSFRDLTHERYLARCLGKIQSFAGIVGRDSSMLAIFDLIRQIADSNLPVLIQGESGTGKELIAAALHNEGPRANRLFVPVNCGALPEGLLESELFGHVKGAFTGAIRDKKGRFELADGGTIFLDEIGDISPAMQVKLLRVLQEGHFERVGGETTIKVNVRVISATNKDIDREVAEGRFREDLYYRLSVIPIVVPPLRERRNDIPLLVDHILKQAAEELGKPLAAVSPSAMDALMSHDWPGNVRELQNWLQFALVMSKGAPIEPSHFPPSRVVSGFVPRAPKKPHLDATTVESAIRAANGNKVEAAQRLGISRATLYRFLDAHRPNGG